MTTERQDAQIIVVGVDGSAGSLRAVRWALEEAHLRGSAIEVVTAWHPDSATGAPAPHAAEEIQRRVLRDAVAESGWEPLISAEVEMGLSEEVLVRRSEGASLLVIGSHGVGSVRHAALGSTSEYCSRMAMCPVVVLPIPASTVSRANLVSTSRDFRP